MISDKEIVELAKSVAKIESDERAIELAREVISLCDKFCDTLFTFYKYTIKYASRKVIDEKDIEITEHEIKNFIKNVLPLIVNNIVTTYTHLRKANPNANKIAVLYTTLLAIFNPQFLEMLKVEYLTFMSEDFDNLVKYYKSN